MFSFVWMGIKEIVKEAKNKGFSKEDIVSELKRKGYSREEIDKAFFDGGKRKAREQIKGEKLSDLKKIGYLFSKPGEVFNNFYEETIVRALGLYAIIAVIVSLLGAGVLFILRGFSGGVDYSFFVFDFILIVILLGISIGGTFVYAGISHLVVRGLGGSGSFVDSYNVCTYSLIPCLIISLIVPYIGWLSIIYSIILMSFGLSEYHGISRGRAVIAALLPVIIVFVLFVLLFLYVVFVFFRGGFVY